eukprot:Cvel_1950.t2-p1 / transcript=Cvel_1950.t2 / gene=Cvel_1950 / organism=Chromera_velia_CCMP2878 / gene_product=hypothetical protein / transcript_product=hypothetical protein / location=Cvel_scaffold74:5833-8052(-) / protein_length=740 / sequence_SO=supercontig / SO=protein_coding / is_pseudo=false
MPPPPAPNAFRQNLPPHQQSYPSYDERGRESGPPSFPHASAGPDSSRHSGVPPPAWLQSHPPARGYRQPPGPAHGPGPGQGPGMPPSFTPSGPRAAVHGGSFRSAVPAGAVIDSEINRPVSQSPLIPPRPLGPPPFSGTGMGMGSGGGEEPLGSPATRVKKAEDAAWEKAAEGAWGGQDEEPGGLSPSSPSGVKDGLLGDDDGGADGDLIDSEGSENNDLELERGGGLLGVDEEDLRDFRTLSQGSDAPLSPLAPARLLKNATSTGGDPALSSSSLSGGLPSASQPSAAGAERGGGASILPKSSGSSQSEVEDFFFKTTPSPTKKSTDKPKKPEFKMSDAAPEFKPRSATAAAAGSTTLSVDAPSFEPSRGRLMLHQQQQQQMHVQGSQGPWFQSYGGGEGDPMMMGHPPPNQPMIPPPPQQPQPHPPLPFPPQIIPRPPAHPSSQNRQPPAAAGGIGGNMGQANNQQPRNPLHMQAFGAGRDGTGQGGALGERPIFAFQTGSGPGIPPPPPPDSAPPPPIGDSPASDANRGTPSSDVKRGTQKPPKGQKARPGSGKAAEKSTSSSENPADQQTPKPFSSKQSPFGSKGGGSRLEPMKWAPKASGSSSSSSDALHPTSSVSSSVQPAQEEQGGDGRVSVSASSSASAGGGAGKVASRASSSASALAQAASSCQAEPHSDERNVSANEEAKPVAASTAVPGTGDDEGRGEAVVSEGKPKEDEVEASGRKGGESAPPAQEEA